MLGDCAGVVGGRRNWGGDFPDELERGPAGTLAAAGKEHANCRGRRRMRLSGEGSINFRQGKARAAGNVSVV